MEQWHPSPVRLTRAIMEAPDARRRQWAIFYRTMYEIAFHKFSRGEEPTIRELLAWAGDSNKDRARRAKADAQAEFDSWTRTLPGQAPDKGRTEVEASKPLFEAPVGQKPDKPRTLARALPSTGKNYITPDHPEKSAEVTPRSPSVDGRAVSVNPSDSGLPRSIAAALWKAGIQTLGDLCAYSRTGLVGRVPEIGRRRDRETIEGVLRQHGLLWAVSTYQPEGPKDATAPTGPREAWDRILLALNDHISETTPCAENGWHLWPIKKNPAVHEAMMEALCDVTGERYRPYAWQKVRQARQEGPNSFPLNEIGRKFRQAYPKQWQAQRQVAK